MPKSKPVLGLPSTGFLRANQIIGNPKKGIPGLLPVSRSTFWNFVRDGRFGPGVLLSPKCRCWRVEEVLLWIENVGAESSEEAGA
jgi:prophage regulatory protein